MSNKKNIIHPPIAEGIIDTEMNDLKDRLEKSLSEVIKMPISKIKKSIRAQVITDRLPRSQNL